jgi:hypothetical protein
MTYIGKCKAKGCHHAARVEYNDVQQLDSGRKAKSARTGEMFLIDLRTLRAYDRSRPFILNGIAVSNKCPEHGVYRLQPVKGRLVPDHKCDVRCTGATGPKCDCSCGGANHGSDHA